MDRHQHRHSVAQPGLWHRSNRTASRARTTSCGGSRSAAASRQPHCTASWGGQRCTDVGRTTTAALQPGFWHRSNRTASCVRTASWGRSHSAAATRQAHRTAPWGGQIQSRQRSCPLRGGVVQALLAATRGTRVKTRAALAPVSGTWYALSVTGGC